MNRDQMYVYLKNIFKQTFGNRPFNSFNKKSVDQIVTTKYPQVTIHIRFPGYKTTANSEHPDYLVQLDQNGKRTDVSHMQILTEFHDFVAKDPAINGPLAERLLLEINHKWEDFDISAFSAVSFNSMSLEELVECICYIAIQEEINYPQSAPGKNYDGCKRPFYSYLEGIYSANGSGFLTLNRAIERCKYKGKIEKLNKPIPYNRIY